MEEYTDTDNLNDSVHSNIKPIMPSAADAFEDNSDFTKKLKIFSIVILKLILGSIALYLSWNCNVNSSLVLKIFYAIFTFIFAELYIIYYAIYRLYMGNSCSS